MKPEMGGVTVAIQMLASGLNSLGVENEIVSLDHPNSPFLKEHPLIVHALGPGDKIWRYSSKLIPWLKINSLRFDAMIVHGLWLFNGYALKSALRSFQKSIGNTEALVLESQLLYVMPHGMLDPYFQRTPGRKFKAIRNKIYWELIEKKLVNAADAVFFTCREELLLARQTFTSYKPKNEVAVGLGIHRPPLQEDISRQAFVEKFPRLKGKRYLLFLGRIDPKKGIDLLLEAYSTICSEYPGHEASADGITEIMYPTLPQLVIAGPGLQSTFGKRIESYLNQNSILKNHVIFTGLLTGPDKWAAIYGCEALVLPSHQENFGLVLAESLACGRHVLTSDKVNIWREIQESSAGMVDKDTVEGISTMLRAWFKTTDAERQQMNMQASKCFDKHFSIESAAAKVKNAILTQKLSPSNLIS